MIPAIVFTVFGLALGIIPAFVYRRQGHKCAICHQAFVLITFTGLLLVMLGIGMIVTEVQT